VPDGGHEAELLRRETEQARRASRRDRLRIVAAQACLLTLILGGWAWASGRVLDRLFLSDPISVGRAFWTIVLKGTLWFHLRFTLTETLLGYLIGAGLGLAGALLVSMIPSGEVVLRPFVLSAYATPKIALAPLMIIWFGIGMLPKVVLAATFVFFVVFLSTLAGVAAVPPPLVAVIRVMGASPATVFRKVVLPSALPFIVTAFRVTIPAALIGAIIGEFISSNRGVGYLINADDMGGLSKGNGITGEGVFSRCVFGTCQGGPPEVFSSAAYWDAGASGRFVLVPGRGAQPAPCRGTGGVTALRLGADASRRATFTVAWCSPSMQSAGAPSVSSAGADAGVVWVIDTRAFGSSAGSGTLYALDGVTGTQVYASEGRDALGSARQFIAVSVAGGRVYVGAGRTVVAYGLK